MEQGSGIYRLIAIVFVALLAVIVIGYLAIRHLGREDSMEIETVPPPVAEPTPVAETTPTLGELWSERLQGVTLRSSDEVVRALVAELSAHPKLAAWLVNDDLIRRFTAAVDNIAHGSSPRAHVGFLDTGESFRVLRRGDALVADPRSFRRYDLVTEVFVSLDTAGAVALYRELRPLIGEAYREIAPPGARFDDALLTAIDHLQAAPLIAADSPLEEKVVTFVYQDEGLEGLSEAQRHLLRTGPDNVRRIQAKLSALEAELRGGE
jgi:hypothetical protein